MPKLPKSLLRIGFVLIILTAIYLFLLLVALPSCERWSWSHKLSTALAGARSVTFVEFTPYGGSTTTKIGSQEVVFQRLDATPEQINALRAATSRFFVFSYYVIIPASFIPHHRVEVLRRDGSTLRMEIGFNCWSFRFNQEHEEPIPLSWLEPLRQFFSDVGMPPRTDAEYQQIAEQMAKAFQSPKGN